MDIEFQTREEIKRFQEELLQKQVAFLAAHSAYYQRVFEAEHIQPESIRTLEDLHKARFIRISPSGMAESHPHDITITQETPNYK